MKIRVFALCLLLCALLSLTAFAWESDARLQDYADVLTEKEETKVLAKLDAISSNLDVVVATIDEGDPGKMWVVAQEIFIKSGYTDGIILLWRRGTEYNEYYFLPVGEGEKIFDDDVLDALEGDCLTHLRNKNFSKAFLTYADVCEEAIAAYGRVDTTPIILCILLGAVLSTLIPMASLKSQLKSVRSKPAAESYVRTGSFALTEQRDIFLYRNVTRVAKPKNNSSGGRSGGGGGRAGRGGRC